MPKWGWKMRICEQVFISYSHRDQTWLESLQTHLRPLVRAGKLDLWDDARIGAGQQWRAEIDQALARARVAVLLVSPDFLASDFVADVELPAILRAAQRGTLQVIWIPIRASLFGETELGKYQAAWGPARPLAELRRA
jgi:internalin A